VTTESRTVPGEVHGAIRGLRVLAFCDYFATDSSGGSERVAAEVYGRLTTAGADLVLLTTPTGATPKLEPFPVIARRGYDLSRLIGGQFSVSPAAWRAGFAWERRHRPQVIHTHSLHFHGSVVAATVARRRGVPLVTTAHVASLDELGGALQTATQAYEAILGRYITRASAATIAVSESVARHLRSRGVPNDRIHVVPNGVDHERFPPSPTPHPAKPTILFVGRLIANKGPDLLLRAAARLRAERRAFRLVFVGDGPLQARLESTAAELGLAGDVTFPGHVSDVHRWIAESTLIVRPSYTEGMPLTVLEAMAVGRCVVASDLEANRELVRDGETGLVFRTGDSMSLADALRRLLDDPALTGRLADGARWAATQYSWDAAAASYGSILAAVASGAAATTSASGS
jgi:glycosyltransferase involved in cell wall biosynthesis